MMFLVISRAISIVFAYTFAQKFVENLICEISFHLGIWLIKKRQQINFSCSFFNNTFVILFRKAEKILSQQKTDIAELEHLDYVLLSNLYVIGPQICIRHRMSNTTRPIYVYCPIHSLNTVLFFHSPQVSSVSWSWKLKFWATVWKVILFPYLLKHTKTVN